VPILKATTKQPKNAIVASFVLMRISRRSWEKYRGSSLVPREVYVVSEALLGLVFNKDAEFKEWLERQDSNGKQSDGEHTPVTKEKTKQPLATAAVQPSTNGKRGTFQIVGFASLNIYERKERHVFSWTTGGEKSKN